LGRLWNKSRQGNQFVPSLRSKIRATAGRRPLLRLQTVWIDFNSPGERRSRIDDELGQAILAEKLRGPSATRPARVEQILDLLSTKTSLD